MWLTLPWSSLCAADPAADLVVLTGRAMGTTWSAKFLQPPPPAPALDSALVTTRLSAALEHLENIFSTYRPDSELSRFNATTSPDWFPVSPELVRVALDSRRISELTAGAFDPTVEPLLRLWGFGPVRRTATLPTEAEIATARLRVDYRRLEIRLSPPALRKTRSTLASSSAPASSSVLTAGTLAADFSSIAKGFAADSLSELLTSLGARHHFVQIGGDIKTSGHPPTATAWRTGIAHPATTILALTVDASSSSASVSSPHLPATRVPTTSSPSPALSAIVALSGQALSTSGDTRNFTTLAGQRYGHIIDPRTGRPATSTLASVSVIHSSGATSSALATALFVLGSDAGYALAVREHFACLFIFRADPGGDTSVSRATPEFAPYAAPSRP